MSAKVTISLEEYEELLESSTFLEALETAGVKSCKVYQDAENIYDQINNGGDYVPIYSRDGATLH